MPRASCRLHCRIRKGRDRIRARIVDVSEGGLCLLSQVWLEPKKKYDIAIDVPGTGESIVRAEIWHARRQKSRESRRKIWAIGVMLEESDAAYHKLLRAAGLAPEGPAPVESPPQSDAKSGRPALDSAAPGRSAASKPTPKPTPKPTAKPLPPQHEVAPEDAIEPRVFRIRVKAKSGPRTRLLTLTAESEEEARRLAAKDLESMWIVMDVNAA